jgi:hypothetical protein
MSSPKTLFNEEKTISAIIFYLYPSAVSIYHILVS